MENFFGYLNDNFPKIAHKKVVRKRYSKKPNHPFNIIQKIVNALKE